MIRWQVCGGNENHTSEWQRKSMHNTSRRGWITKNIKISSDKPQLSPNEIAIKEDSRKRKEIRDFIIQKRQQGMSPEEI